MSYRAPLLTGSIAVLLIASLTPTCIYAQTTREPVPPEFIHPDDNPKLGTEIAEHKIDQFADAFLAVEKVNAKATAELKTTKNATEAERVKSNAETQIIQAVERSGLQLEEFNRITEMMMADLTLRTKIATRVEQRRGS